MRSRLVPAVLVRAVTGLAGWGVPDAGPAVVVSSQAPAGYDGDDPNGARQPVQPDPAGAATPDDLVSDYLAAAGANPARVTANVSRFFTPGHEGWQATSPVIVRVTGYADGPQ